MTRLTAAAHQRRQGFEAAAGSTDDLDMVNCGACEFDRVAAGFDDIVPEQMAAFVAARWSGRRIDHRLFVQGDDVVAAASVIRVPMLGAGIAAVKWGPLWRRSGAMPVISTYRAAVAALVADYSTRRGMMLTIMPPADPLHGSAMLAALDGLGFRRGAEEQHAERYFVDLEPKIGDIRASLAAKWRYNLSKAEAAGGIIRVVRGRSGLDAFMPLYAEMLRRKGFHDDSAVGTLPSLYDAPQEMRPVTVIAEKDGAAVAGAIVAILGDTARYLYGASADDGLKYKPGYVLQFEAVRWLKANTNCRWYALGGTDGSEGLAQFKRGFVGRDGRICDEPMAFELAASRHAALVGRGLFTLRELKRGAAVAVARAKAALA